MEKYSMSFDRVDEDAFPYLMFLPKDRGKLIKMLNDVFGSNVKIDILKRFRAYENDRVYQKELVETLPYSNKTVLKNLKELCAHNIFVEGMEKHHGNKDVWVKYYLIDEKMRWLVLLFEDPSEISNMGEIILQLAKLYYESLVKVAAKYGICEDDIKNEIGLSSS
ncbi:MAG: hypothetical protein ACXQTP_07115 [Candidatus Methanofastidiosia archaeon]